MINANRKCRSISSSQKLNALQVLLTE